MAERRGARLVTQRRLEVAPPVGPAVDPSPAPPAAAPTPPPSARPASEPVPASNRGLLERQLRWHRERTKFENEHPANETSP